MRKLNLVTELPGTQVVMEQRCQFRLSEKTTENGLLPTNPG